jgi:hypothetical protein
MMSFNNKKLLIWPFLILSFLFALPSYFLMTLSGIFFKYLATSGNFISEEYFSIDLC